MLTLHLYHSVVGCVLLSDDRINYTCKFVKIIVWLEERERIKWWHFCDLWWSFGAMHSCHRHHVITSILLFIQVETWWYIDSISITVCIMIADSAVNKVNEMEMKRKKLLPKFSSVFDRILILFNIKPLHCRFNCTFIALKWFLYADLTLGMCII